MVLLKISVAMAVYNGGKYLAEQLDSILKQLRPEDELIISDDGSADGTKELVNAYCMSDARIRLIDGPKCGVVKNFQNALEHCTGEIIFLSDQDDVWADDKVAEVLKAFENPETVLVMHDAAVTDISLEVVQNSFFATRNTAVGFYKNLWKNSYIGCCMAFRSALLPIVLPFPDRLPMHDQWIGLLAEKQGGVALLPQPLLYYRRHGANATGDAHGSVADMIRNRFLFLRLFRERLVRMRGCQKAGSE